MALNEGFVESQRLSRSFVYDEHEVAEGVDLDGFHILKAAIADGALRALAVELDVAEPRGEAILRAHR